MSAGNDATSGDVAAFVRLRLAAACRVDAATLTDDTPLLALHADSLTLVAVLSQIEAVFTIDFSVDETADLLTANSLGELVAAVKRRVEARPPARAPRANPDF